jgi:hypothetical protein
MSQVLSVAGDGRSILLGNWLTPRAARREKGGWVCIDVGISERFLREQLRVVASFAKPSWGPRTLGAWRILSIDLVTSAPSDVASGRRGWLE